MNEIKSIITIIILMDEVDGFLAMKPTNFILFLINKVKHVMISSVNHWWDSCRDNILRK